MRVVIADDESLVRYSLKSMLLESDPSVTIAAEARNGEELVSAVRRFQPDLAFVDIRMPKLDGLEAIAKGSAVSPNTHWVILTSYSEFEYAKQALRLGVADYLLKPVGPDELHGVLDREAALLAQARGARSDEFESALNALLNRTAPETTINARFAAEGTSAAALLLLLDGGESDAERIERQVTLSTALREAMRELATIERPAALVPLSGGDLCAAVAWSSRKADGGNAAYRRLVNRASSLAASIQTGLVTLVATDECSSFTTLAHEVWRILELKGLRAVASAGKVLSARELFELAEHPSAHRLAEGIESAIDAARSRMPLALLASLDDVDELLRGSPLLGGAKTQASVVRFLSRALPGDLADPLEGSGRPHEEPADFLARLQSLRTRVEHRMRSGSEPLGDQVDQVRAYIDQRYAEELRIADVARLLRVTPNYLSNLFHKKVGKTFVHYLTERRMEHAKILLRTPGIQVQAVARSVGYQSTRHFTRVFKAYCGLYPSDFRARNRRPDEAQLPNRRV